MSGIEPLETGTSEPFRLGRHAALEAIRGFAILVIVGRHLNRYGLVRGGGALGVGMFFALAGFLSAASLLGEYEESGRLDVIDYLRRRVLRIVPLLVVFVAVLVLYSQRVPEFIERREAVATLRFTANLAMITGDPIGPVTHTWFLSAIVQILVAWFVVFALIVRLGRRRAVIATVVLAGAAWALRLWMLYGDVAFERMRSAPDTRADAFLIGAAAALLLAHLRPRPPGWLMVAATATLLWQMTVPPADEWTIALGWTLVPAATATLALGAVTHPGRCVENAAWPPLVWLGTVSYSLYLWHFALYRILDQELGLGGWTRTVVLVGTSLLVAAISYRLIEVPAARRLSGDRRT